MTEIAVSVISGLLTLVGVCVTAWFGNRRTSMAEAACRSLHDDGYEVCMYYQMD